MKTKLKYSVCVVLIICAMVLLFNGCGGNNNDVSSLLNDNNTKKEDLKEAKLTFYFWAQEANATREVLDEVEKKVKDKLNIKLDFKFMQQSPENYVSKMKEILDSGSPCDAFYYSNRLPVQLNKIVQDGIAKDITSIFSKNAPSYYKKFTKEELNAASVDGKIYAIPSRLPMTQMRCAIVREDLMKKYNIPEIKNYDDYEVYLKTIKEKEPNFIPMLYRETAIGLFAEANGYVILDYVQGLVYKWDDPSMKIYAWEQTPEFKKGLDTINRWYKNGYLLKDIGIANIDESLVASGKYASFISVLGSDIIYNSIVKAKSGADWRYKAYSLSDGKASERLSSITDSLVINSKSENAERVLMFIEWLQSKQENYDSLMYGIKGKHYLLEGEQTTLPKDVNGNDSAYNWGWRGSFINIDYERTDVSSSIEAKKAYYKEVNEKTKYPPHLGFYPDYELVTNVTTLRQLSFYRTEQSIYTGVFKEEDVDTYIKDQKDNGVDQLVNEVQKQIDKWKAQ